MIENIVRRAKKLAIKRFIAGGIKGIRTAGPARLHQAGVQGARGPAQHHQPGRLGQDLGQEGRADRLHPHAGQRGRRTPSKAAEPSSASPPASTSDPTRGQARVVTARGVTASPAVPRPPKPTPPKPRLLHGGVAFRIGATNPTPPCDFGGRRRPRSPTAGPRRSRRTRRPKTAPFARRCRVAGSRSHESDTSVRSWRSGRAHTGPAQRFGPGTSTPPAPYGRAMGIDCDIMRLAELRTHLLEGNDLHALGLSRWQIRTRIEQQKLFPIYNGVLSTIPPPFDFVTRARAVCLAVPDGVLSFSTAAFLHGIRRSPREWLDVTVPAPRRAPARRPLPPVEPAAALRCQRDDRRPPHDHAGAFAVRPRVGAGWPGPPIRGRGRSEPWSGERPRARRGGEPAHGPGTTRHASCSAPWSTLCSATRRCRATTSRSSGTPWPPPASRRTCSTDSTSPTGHGPSSTFALVDRGSTSRSILAVTHADRAGRSSDKARDVQVTLAGWLPLRFTDSDVDRRLASIVRLRPSPAPPPTGGVTTALSARRSSEGASPGHDPTPPCTWGGRRGARSRAERGQSGAIAPAPCRATAAG